SLTAEADDNGALGAGSRVLPRARFGYARSRAARMAVRTIEWRNGRVVMLDQRLLPTREVYRVYSDHRQVARAIKDMVIGGAPAIGVAAAMGIALGARTPGGDFGRHFERLCRTFTATRPTAVNLFWAIERIPRVFARNRRRSPATLRTILEREALDIHDEEVAA